MNRRKSPTEPLLEPSCADFPFVLKVTPLGALDFTSMLAASSQLELLFLQDYCESSYSLLCGRNPCSGATNWCISGPRRIQLTTRGRTSFEALAMSENAGIAMILTVV